MQIRTSFISFLVLLFAVAALGCKANTDSRYLVYVTSESGDRLTERTDLLTASDAQSAQAVIVTDHQRQTIDGFGASLTESSAFVLACLTEQQRQTILRELFSKDGANFSVSRTHIGASDFSVEGKYSLAEVPGDTALLSFSLDRDKEGFSRTQYPQIQNEHYDLYHLMKDVWAIKQADDEPLRLIATTWTAPDWMKDNKKYYERENGVARGGQLLPEYYRTYAHYLAKYLEAWREEGINFWAITPVNEPQGNDGGWESMELSPQVEAELIANHIAPVLEERALSNVEIWGFDQNIFEMMPYCEAIYGSEQAYNATAGMAVHWYGSTIGCFPETLDEVHNRWPDKRIFHSEGCIDNLGCPGWPGVGDYAGYQESGWFNNDAFWWNKNATDWAYSTQWAGNTHPKYAPVHRYAQYIIDGLNHWLTGFCDWNIVLDSIGGPNHVANYCGAPVMIDYANNIIYFTPYYYVLKHFSKFIQPGDVVLETINNTGIDGLYVCAIESKEQGAKNKDNSTIVITALNMNKTELTFPLQVGNTKNNVTIPANAIITIKL